MEQLNLECQVAGVTFRRADAMAIVEAAAKNVMDVRLTREPNNPHDAAAIRVECRQAVKATTWRHVGFIPNPDRVGLAAILAPAMDAGAVVKATLLDAGKLDRDPRVPWIKLGLCIEGADLGAVRKWCAEQMGIVEENATWD